MPNGNAAKPAKKPCWKTSRKVKFIRVWSVVYAISRAFVDLGGADGLIHISELAWHRVKHPREILNVGDEVEVYVLRLDDEGKRIGLSLKRLQQNPWELVESMYQHRAVG